MDEPQPKREHSFSLGSSPLKNSDFFLDARFCPFERSFLRDQAALSEPFPPPTPPWETSPGIALVASGMRKLFPPLFWKEETLGQR